MTPTVGRIQKQVILASCASFWYIVFPLSIFPLLFVIFPLIVLLTLSKKSKTYIVHAGGYVKKGKPLHDFSNCISRHDK